MISISASINSMPLYTHLDRIDRPLAILGIGPSDPIQPEQIFPFDQWHYQGTEAVRWAAEHLGVKAASRYLTLVPALAGLPVSCRILLAVTSLRLNCSLS